MNLITSFDLLDKEMLSKRLKTQTPWSPTKLYTRTYLKCLQENAMQGSICRPILDFRGHAGLVSAARLALVSQFLFLIIAHCNRKVHWNTRNALEHKVATLY